MELEEIIKQLKKHSNARDRQGMARFGINPKYALGVRVPVLRSLAKRIGKSHSLAQELWRSKIHEARILASMIDEPEKVSREQMEKWVKDFNSWDLCDQCCTTTIMTGFVESTTPNPISARGASGSAFGKP